MSQVLKVFLSSTSVDLTQHRTAVSNVILRLQQLPIQMETFGARPGAPVAECRRLVEQSDAVVVVVGYRYGWIPSAEDGGDGEKSITWLEVDAAIDTGKPVFAYLLDETVPAPASDDANRARLERFRAVLGKRVRDTFSSPDDLAKKVSVALAHWLINSRYDFPSSLQSLNMAEVDFGAEPPGARLGLADILRDPLLGLAMSGEPVELTQFDQALSGPHLRTAREQRDQFVSHGKQHLHSIRANILRTESENAELTARIRSIESESPPHSPVRRQPSPGFDDGMTDDQRRYWTERLNSEYQEKVRQYDLATKEYGQRKLALGGYRERKNQLQQQADQLRSQLAAFEESFAAHCLELDRAINAARGRDIVHLLADLRDSAARDLNERAVVARGFVRSLAVQVLVPFLRRWLEPSSITATEQLTEDLRCKTDEAIRSQHRHIGYELLQPLALLHAALKRNEQEMGCIRMVLNALPGDELARTGSTALTMVRESEFNEVPPYDHIINPAELTTISSMLATSREQLLAVQQLQQTFLDGTRELLEQVNAAQAKVASYRSRIKDVAARFQPHLTEVALLWRLLARAQHDARLDESLVFTSALQQEATRRFGQAPSDLLELCERTRFLLEHAESALPSHSSTTFIEKREALRARLDELRKLQPKYEFALEDIVRVPERNAEEYSGRMWIYALGAVIPLINLLCAVLMLSNIFKLEAAWRSSLSCYLELKGLGTRLCALMSTVSLLCLGPSAYWLYPLEELSRSTDPTLAIAVVTSYALTLVLALWSLITLWSYRAATQTTQA